MSKPVRAGKIRRRVIAGVLLAAAAVMLFLAYQSVTTDQYRLYSRNYQYYVSEAAECRALQDGPLGAHYAYLAGEWEGTAQMAGAYLTQHRAGAASLGVVCAACIFVSARLLMKNKKDDD